MYFKLATASFWPTQQLFFAFCSVEAEEAASLATSRAASAAEAASLLQWLTKELKREYFCLSLRPSPLSLT